MSNDLVVRQPSFLESILDPRVRRMWNNDGFYVSILDVFEYHGHKTNPSLSWKQTLDWMIYKQGFQNQTTEIIDWRPDGQNGGRTTPMIHEDLFYRILQSADVPEWEPLRVFGAALMKQEVSKPKRPFKPIQSPMFRRAIDAGYTKDEAEAAALIRESLKETTKQTNAVRQAHGAEGADFGRLAALDSQVATGKTPAQWRQELGADVTPADYLSPLDNISLAYEKRRASQEHEANQSRGVDALAQDIQAIAPEVRNNKEILGDLLQGVPLPRKPIAAQRKLLGK